MQAWSFYLHTKLHLIIQAAELKNPSCGFPVKFSWTYPWSSNQSEINSTHTIMTLSVIIHHHNTKVFLCLSTCMRRPCYDVRTLFGIQLCTAGTCVTNKAWIDFKCE